jgi:hypothetical protein
MLKTVRLPLILIGLGLLYSAHAQDANSPASAKPTEHVIGTVIAADPTTHTVTVKEDRSGTEHVILLANTRTLIKVPPGAKDLKTGTRITADDLAVGDRVDVRGSKPADDPEKIAARSVVLMSGRDLQQAHQAQAAEWQHSTAGTVAAIDAAGGKIIVNVRSAEGPKQVSLETSPFTEFTRYSPESPASPASSQLADIQPGDQVRVIGDKSEDGATIKASKVYSGAFRTLNATVTAIGADGKSLTVKDLSSKKLVEITLTDQSSIRRLPPMVAAGLARRLNPSARGVAGTGSGNPSGGGSPQGGPTPGANAPPAGGPSQASGQGESGPAGSNPGGAGRTGTGGMRGNGNGDISQMIDRLPKIAVADLKPGDALVISGVAAGAGNGQLVANNIIAGVEPILQSAPARQGGQATGGDWGLGEMTAPQ